MTKPIVIVTDPEIGKHVAMALSKFDCTVVSGTAPSTFVIKPLPEPMPEITAQFKDNHRHDWHRKFEKRRRG